jgi:Cu/Ag efflux pump CusA
MEVSLKMGERSKEEFLAALRADFASCRVQIVVGQPISHRIDHMLSGSRQHRGEDLRQPDLAELRS